MKSKIVVIDDEQKLLKVIKRALEIEGYTVFDFDNPFSGLDFIKTREFDLVISDIRMNGMTGLDLLNNIRNIYPDKPVILMTAYSSMETAVTAVKLGASDYLLKPFELQELKDSVAKILSKRTENEQQNSNGPKIIGNSPEILNIQEIINNISDTDSTVLITGESGTGKELIAQKVDRLVVMAGHFEDPQYREYNVVNDISACQKVYAEWPTDIYTSGFEVGLRIKYPAKSIENDFKWTENHPITDAYKSYLAKIEDRPTWDLTAVLFAIDPGSLFNVSPAGRITVTDEGCTHFTQDMQGNRYYLKVTDNQCKNILRYFLNMIPRNPEDYKKLK